MGKTQAPVPSPPPEIQALIPIVLCLIFGGIARWLKLEQFLAWLVGSTSSSSSSLSPTGDDIIGLRWFATSIGWLMYVSNFLGSRVVRARYKHNVPLPFMYPADATNFCNEQASHQAKDKRSRQEIKQVEDPVGYLQVVRGHENFVEGIALHMSCAILLAIAIEKLPLVASLGNFIFGIGRVWYATGYTSESMGPSQRLGGLLLGFAGTGMIIGQLLWFAILGPYQQEA